MNIEKNSNVQKLVIIGGGPAGLSAAIYASRAMLSPLVIEGNPAGGQLLLTSEVENYPGFPEGIMGPQLVSNMRKQAERFETKFITENVTNIIRNPKSGIIEITLTNNETILSKTVLVTTGANAKWLGLPAEKEFMGRGVSACATCDGFFFRNKEVAIVGGGDSAMEEALFLTKFASKVYLIHRRDTFKASKIMQERVKSHPKIEIILNTTVEDIKGSQVVEKAILKDINGEISELAINGIFIAIGHEPATKFMLNSGVFLDEKDYIVTTDRALFEKLNINKKNFSDKYRYATNVEGIFAAGDCTDPSYRQAGTAVGMAIAAEIEIERYLESLEA